MENIDLNSFLNITNLQKYNIGEALGFFHNLHHWNIEIVNVIYNSVMEVTLSLPYMEMMVELMHKAKDPNFFGMSTCRLYLKIYKGNTDAFCKTKS